MAAHPPRKSPADTAAISPARREAFSILLEIEQNHTHSDHLLRSPRVSALSPQDRNLCTTLVMDTLRWQLRLDALIRPLLTRPNARLDPEIRIALRLGALQLLFLDRIPAHAAISESVALAKHAGHKFASGMVNAVLRKLALQPKPSLDPRPDLSAQQLAEATAHPAWLVERWVAAYGSETARNLCLHGQRQPELTLRLDSSELDAELAEQGIRLSPGALLTSARRVISGDVTATPAFLNGRIRIQDEGSQLIAELCGHGTKILDACAAPGGKTLILAERNPQAHITACEISPARLDALQARVAASPYADQIEVRLADATQLPGSEFYDLVLADVPCSGTGTLGRNPEIRHYLQPADLDRHHDRQCHILRAALGAASNRVIYSTCSLEPEENGAVVAEVLAQSSNWRQIPVSAVFEELRQEGRLTPASGECLRKAIFSDGSMTILPGSLGPEIQTDGFFLAMLEKQG
jgi:16S rRNA (cytosine967-C5)-methyltransferase